MVEDELAAIALEDPGAIASSQVGGLATAARPSDDEGNAPTALDDSSAFLVQSMTSARLPTQPSDDFASSPFIAFDEEAPIAFRLELATGLWRPVAPSDEELPSGAALEFVFLWLQTSPVAVALQSMPIAAILQSAPVAVALDVTLS
jgi:hypothetical protein